LYAFFASSFKVISFINPFGLQCLFLRTKVKHQVSSGTVSNVLKQNREQPESFNKSDRVTTFTKEVLDEVEFKKNPDISIGNHVIINTQDFEENGYPIEDRQGQGQKGGPLSWFTKTRDGYGSEIKSETYQFVTPVLTDLPTINSELPSNASMCIGILGEQ
jgi:hypothetical protein